MPDRLTILMQNTTNPDNPTQAIPHTGGWSESHFSTTALVAGTAKIFDLLRARAWLLPKTANIVGYRIGRYDIVGNRIKPLGAATARYQVTGNPALATDIPQMSLMFAATGAGVANTSRFAARCIPDSQVLNGEYQPATNFINLVTRYRNLLVQGGWGFVGRVLTAASNSLVSIAAGAVVVQNAAALGIVVGDYVRFYRATDDFGNPITGAFQVLAINFGTNTLTLKGFDPTIAMTLGNGLLRVDLIAFFSNSTVETVRIVPRKVGRPFESYRGRRSNRR